MLSYLLHLDYWLFNLINSHWTSEWLDDYFISVTDLHKVVYVKILALPLIFFLFYAFLKKESWKIFIALILSVGFSDFLGGKAKSLFERPRPTQNSELNVIQRSQAGHFSFYSNHASNMFTFASYTSQFIPQIRVATYLFAASVAYSRVYNGVHYPTDILFGSLVGICIGLMSANLTRRFLLKNSTLEQQ